MVLLMRKLYNGLKVTDIVGNSSKALASLILSVNAKLLHLICALPDGNHVKTGTHVHASASRVHYL